MSVQILQSSFTSPITSHSLSTFSFPFFFNLCHKKKIFFCHTPKKKYIFLCPLSHLSPVCVCEKNPNDFSRPNCLDTREQLKKSILRCFIRLQYVEKVTFPIILCCVLKTVQLESARELYMLMRGCESNFESMKIFLNENFMQKNKKKKSFERNFNADS